MPDQRLEGDWPFPQRLPLGAGWSGTCTASAASEVRPSEQEMKTCCNMGYAKGCTRLPADRRADAVRFSFGDERDGVVRIRFAYEREHLPVAHGELVYDTATAAWVTPQIDACLRRMAACYAEAQRARCHSLPDERTSMAESQLR